MKILYIFLLLIFCSSIIALDPFNEEIKGIFCDDQIIIGKTAAIEIKTDTTIKDYSLILLRNIDKKTFVIEDNNIILSDEKNVVYSIIVPENLEEGKYTIIFKYFNGNSDNYYYKNVMFKDSFILKLKKFVFKISNFMSF